MEANRNWGENLVVKAFAIAVVVVVAGLAGMGLPAAVDAQSPSATRSFSAATVAAGDELEVTVTPGGYGRFGQLVETIPDGFNYVPTGDPGVEDDGQDVILTFVRTKRETETASYTETVSYKVTAATTSGVGSFSGVLKDVDKIEHQVGGQHQVTVGAAYLDLLAMYDDNEDNAIERLEYLAALDDFIDGLIDKAALLEVLDHLIDYLSGG